MRLLAALVVLLAIASPAFADNCQSNLMIVLDRSCSMQQPPRPGGTMSKWQLAGAALQKLTTKYSGKLDFGLIMFPDQTAAQCLQDGPIYVNVGPNHEATVVGKVTGTQPNGPCVTPIKPAFDQVSTDPAYATKYTGVGARSFVLFISDGMQTCGGNDAQIAASIQALYGKGFPTYIVGFGGAVDPVALGQFAAAGGVPRTGDGGLAYYQADDAVSLDQALDEIAGSVVGLSEFGTCGGTPCPDGRCFGAGETCVKAVCIPPSPTGGDGGGGGGNGDGGPGHGSPTGCGCRLAAAPALSSGGALTALGLLGLWLLARRRARRAVIARRRD